MSGRCYPAAAFEAPRVHSTTNDKRFSRTEKRNKKRKKGVGTGARTDTLVNGFHSVGGLKSSFITTTLRFFRPLLKGRAKFLLSYFVRIRRWLKNCKPLLFLYPPYKKINHNKALSSARFPSLGKMFFSAFYFPAIPPPPHLPPTRVRTHARTHARTLTLAFPPQSGLLFFFLFCIIYNKLVTISSSALPTVTHLFSNLTSFLRPSPRRGVSSRRDASYFKRTF